MSDELKLDIPGQAAFLAEFRALPLSVQTRVVKGACGTGTGIVKRKVVSLAPEWHGDVAAGHPPPGTLKKSIYGVRLPEKCTDTLEYWKVGVKTGNSTRKGKKGADGNRGEDIQVLGAFYARFVEEGHFTRTPGLSASQHRKARQAGTAGASGATWVPPQSYMRAGFVISRDEAVAAMQKYMDDNLALATAAMRYIKART